MKPDDQRAETIFAAARELTSPAAQSLYLAKVCGQDESLRKHIEAMLQAEEAAKEFFKGAGRLGPADTRANLANTVVAEIRLSEGPGTKIGRYKLLQQIGEGGMGRRNPSAAALRSRSSSSAWTPGRLSHVSKPNVRRSR